MSDMNRESATYAIEQVITQDENYSHAAEGLRVLLGELRDLELSNSKLEMDLERLQDELDDLKRQLHGDSE